MTVPVRISASTRQISMGIEAAKPSSVFMLDTTKGVMRMRFPISTEKLVGQ
jgi:hypothetical protein